MGTFRHSKCVLLFPSSFPRDPSREGFRERVRPASRASPAREFSPSARVAFRPNRRVRRTPSRSRVASRVGRASAAPSSSDPPPPRFPGSPSLPQERPRRGRDRLRRRPLRAHRGCPRGRSRLRRARFLQRQGLLLDHRRPPRGEARAGEGQGSPRTPRGAPGPAPHREARDAVHADGQVQGAARGDARRAPSLRRRRRERVRPPHRAPAAREVRPEQAVPQQRED